MPEWEGGATHRGEHKWWHMCKPGIAPLPFCTLHPHLHTWGYVNWACGNGKGLIPFPLPPNLFANRAHKQEGAETGGVAFSPPIVGRGLCNGAHGVQLPHLAPLPTVD